MIFIASNIEVITIFNMKTKSKARARNALKLDHQYIWSVSTAMDSELMDVDFLEANWDTDIDYLTFCQICETLEN